MKEFFYLILVALMWGCSSQCLDGESQVVVQLDGVVNISGVDAQMTFVGEDTVAAEVKTATRCSMLILWESGRVFLRMNVGCMLMAAIRSRWM